MKNNILFGKKLVAFIGFILMFTSISSLHAQFGGGGGGGGGSITIAGPTSVNIGDTKTYTISNSSIHSTTWSVSSNAQVISSFTQSASIRFNSGTGAQITAVSMSGFFDTYMDTHGVNIITPPPANPGNPTVSNNNCGTARLTRSGTPPSGVTWYWQGKNASGTATNLGSGSTYTASQGSGTYYIRARSSSGVWSNGSGSRFVTIVNFSAGSISGTQTICYSGNPSTLGNSASPSGGTSYAYQWQYSSNGSSGWTNISSATATTYNPPGGLTASRWYRRRVISCSQTKYTNSIKVTVTGQIATPTTPSVANNCGSSVLTRSNPPSGITWYWQSSSTGTSTSNSSVSITRTSGTVYYLRGRNSSGCWGPARTISYSINTVPTTPAAPTVANNCGNSVLTRSNPPSGITFYWQSSSTGTSTSNSSASITRTGGSTYYIRARNNSSGCWSPARTVSYSINAVPATPAAPTVANNCGSSVLTRSNPPSGITFYWQSSSTGTSTSNSSASITRTSGSTYYLRARNNSSGCWSPVRTVNYSINAVPATPAAPTVANNCGSSVLTRSNPPSGITFYWQSSSTGTSTSNSSASITRTSGSTYYLRARNNSSGCWSPVRTVNYNINTVPTIPATVAVANNCGSSVLTRSNPPSGITFYWQSSSTGTSTSNSSASITRTSGSTYYLRARNNSSGCWSPVRTVSYTVNTVPAIPAAPAVANNCGSTVLTRSNPPSGITFYWQSSSTGTSTSNSSASITRTSGSTYYLRGRSSAGCWGAARSINYSITQPTTWYLDADNDGFAISTTSSCSSPGSGYTASTLPLGDLNDGTPNIINITPQNFYQDSDGDGYGDPAVSLFYSNQPTGYVINSLDECPAVAAPGSGNGCLFDPYDPVSISESENYVYTRVPQVAMSSINNNALEFNADIIDQVAYFDGLGRGAQSVGIKQSPDGKDIITHMEYDEYGRQVKEYLPYPGTGSTYGNYKTGDQALAIKQYHTTRYPADFTGVAVANANTYSESLYEASPLNRPLKQAAPGKDWRMGSGHEIGFEYLTNVTGEVSYFEVVFTNNNTETPTLNRNGSYTQGELSKTVTYDENHTTGKDHSTEEFTDKKGMVVLKRTYENEIPHDTYYVYDDFGNLTYVLPPKVTTSNGVSASELSELAYQYKYDYRNRLIEKKIPGKGWEYIVYNKLDQPILTQDPNLRAQNRWLFTKYDSFGRVTYTGITPNSGSRATVQSAANNTTAQFETKRNNFPLNLAGTDVYYSNVSYPTSFIQTLSINYYDNETFDTDGLSIPNSTSFGDAVINTTSGLATGSKVRVLGTNNWITTITGYDYKRRPVYIASKNQELNTTDIVESKLDFVGKVLETKTTHIKGSNAPIVTIEKFTYDHAARLLTQTHKVGNNPEELIASNTYDELGQLIQKGVGNQLSGSRLQTVDYDYNVRGWLSTINDVDNIGNDLFSFRISYNIAHQGGSPLYNGNISGTQWTTANDNLKRFYRYYYDDLNRLTSAVNNNSNYHLQNIDYDKNGNITALRRNGHRNSTATLFGVMDNLVYSYDSGNKLTRVQDNGNDTYGFKDGTNSDNDYSYDQNGNMILDRNKGITGITYNHLNLPTEVIFDNNQNKKITYIYDASGVKIKKTVTDVSSLTTTEYAGNYIYENNSLQFFNHAEGYVEQNGSSFDYIYQYKDHLGNVRLSYSDTDNNGVVNQSEIREENNYYPFGLKHRGYNNNQNGRDHKYGFTGKEEQDELGLGWVDITARNYDAALGRWMNLDPLSEFMFTQSPYNYAFDNPIYFIDPDGLMPSGGPRFEGYYNDGAGNVVYDPKINNQKDLNALGITGASYIGDTYYDSSSNTYYDADGVAHANYERNSLYPSKFRWSFLLWLKNFNAEGNAVERIGSGFVLRGKGNGNKSNNKSDNPEDDTEIPNEVVAALRGITGKYKGVAYKNGVKVLQNGFKDAKKIKRLKKEISNVIKGKGTYNNSSIDSQNYTIQDTTSYILQYWKNGIPMGGSGAGLKAGKKGAIEAAKKEMKGSDLDSIQVIKANN